MNIEVNGVNLYYEVKGTGQPLLMIHGNGEDHTIFTEAAKILSARFSCYLIDSRGHGQSTRECSMDYVSMSEDVLAFCDALQLKHTVYYGFSDGGIIGILAASTRPDLFERMIISGANIQPDGVIRRVYRMVKVMYFFTRSAKVRMMLEQPDISLGQLHRIETPTLVLAGSKDLIREDHTRLIAQNIPGSKLKILPGEGHGSYIVHSEKIAHLILEFTGENAQKEDNGNAV